MLVYYDSEGRIITCTSHECDPPNAVGFVETDRSDWNYVENGELFKFPQKPAGASHFCFKEKRWALKAFVDEWADARATRDRLLLQSDWVTLRAYEQGGVVAQDWLDYRQALRDITNQADPTAIVWPVAPSV